MAISRTPGRVIAAMAACVLVACATGPSAPRDEAFALITVDGHALPYQVGVSTSGQPLVIYSGEVVRNVQNGQCVFTVKLDQSGPLDFTNTYIATEPGECNLRKGEEKTFTYTFTFRNSTANTAHTFGYQ